DPVWSVRRSPGPAAWHPLWTARKADPGTILLAPGSQRTGRLRYVPGGALCRIAVPVHPARILALVDTPHPAASPGDYWCLCRRGAWSFWPAGDAAGLRRYHGRSLALQRASPDRRLLDGRQPGPAAQRLCAGAALGPLQRLLRWYGGGAHHQPAVLQP